MHLACIFNPQKLVTMFKAEEVNETKVSSQASERLTTIYVQIVIL